MGILKRTRKDCSNTLTCRSSVVDNIQGLGGHWASQRPRQAIRGFWRGQHNHVPVEHSVRRKVDAYWQEHHVGIHPEQIPISNPALTIGDRCLINKGTAIVAHFAVEIGDDVFTGHNCYITDQNHGYEDLTQPIGAQSMPEKPVRIGSGSWLGHGVIVVPGVSIGEHVTVAGGSVVTRDVPDRCVVAGAPARIVRRYIEGEGWISVDRS
jgi:acetyltransferase-like isoleucine patch superfamily enzyme